MERFASYGKAWGQFLLLMGLVFSFALVGTGCMQNNDDDDDDGGGYQAADVELFVANNGAADVGDVDLYDEQFLIGGTFSGDTNQGLELDIADNLFGALDDLGGGGGGKANEESNGSKDGISTDGAIDVLGHFRARAGGGSRDVSLDRRIGGMNSFNSQLVSPKGITIAHFEGYLFVADFGAGDIKVFGSAAGGDVPPLATVTTAAPPWDLVFCGIFDDLYVTLTDGRVEVFEDFLDDFGAGGSSAFIVPSDGTSQISTNLHGIDYDFGFDQLALTDVGSPSDAGDGALYLISSTSTASGLTVPDVTVAGSSTMLGNPVDCIFDGDDLYVAEKANGMLLRFNDFNFGTSGDVAPDLMATESSPESLEGRSPTATPGNDVSDIDPSALLIGVATTSNPGMQIPPNPGFGEYARVAPDLALQLATPFPVGEHLENVTFDLAGDAYITFDDGTDQNGGIFVGNRLSRSRDEPAPTSSRDRTITGPATLLASPKGIESVRSLGLMLVADNDAAAPAIRAYGSQAIGNVPPVFSTNLAVGRPWDLDYDPGNDRLFVALTNGNVAVFDTYSVSRGAAGPDRMITPADMGGAVSVNLHGIVYDELTDTLHLSDVGSAADATDGQLFSIPAAATANGMAQVSLRIGGPNSMLGNPVDIAFDGQDLYVAEKSNDLILRFDNVGAAAGGDVAPSRMISRIKPESVALIPSYLSREPTF